MFDKGEVVRYNQNYLQQCDRGPERQWASMWRGKVISVETRNGGCWVDDGGEETFHFFEDLQEAA